MRRLVWAGSALGMVLGVVVVGACASAPTEETGTSSAAVSVGGWSSEWLDLGGTTLSNPSLIGPAVIGGHTYDNAAFVVGNGSSVYYSGFGLAPGVNVPAIQPWTSLGGTVYGDPSAVRGGSGGNAYAAVFVRGLGESAYFQAATGGNAFGGWQPLGGTLTGDPVAVQAGPWVYVFVQGIGNAVYYRRVIWPSVGDPSQYSPWAPLGDATTLPIGVTAQANGNVDVVVTSSAGGAVHQIEYDYATDHWGSWNDLGGSATTGPAVTSGASGQVDVIVGGYENAVWHKGGNGSTFDANWESLAANVYFAPFSAKPSKLAIAAPSATTLEVVVQGSDLHTYHREFDGTSWSGWNPLGGCEFYGGGVALANLGNGMLEAAVRGIDTSIYLDSFSPSPGAPSGTAPPECGCGGQGEACCGSGSQLCSAGGTVCVAQSAPSGGTCEAPPPPPCGGSGQACCTTPGQPVCTATGTYCINNECQACGEAGAACTATSCCEPYACTSGKCAAPPPPSCGAIGAACSASAACCSPNECISGKCESPPPACGAAGAACSAQSPCCSPDTCVSGKCAAPPPTSKTCSGQTATGSAQDFPVEVRTPDMCAVALVAPFANTAAEALGCALAAYPGDAVSSGSGTISEYDYTYSIEDACFNIEVDAFSVSDANQCAADNSPTGEAQPGTCD